MTTNAARSIYHPIQRDRVTFLKTAHETNGELTLVEVELAPGGGTSLHYHLSYSERFSPIVGALGVQVGQAQQTLHAGESAYVERGVIHRFYNPTSEATRFYVEIAPGDLRFEQSLRIAYGLANDGQVNSGGVPKNLLALAVLVELSDTRLVGLVALLNPLFGLLARIGRVRGIDQALIARYAPHTLAR